MTIFLVEKSLTPSKFVCADSRKEKRVSIQTKKEHIKSPTWNIDISAFTETLSGIVIGIVLLLLDVKNLASISFFMGPALSGSRYLLSKKVEIEISHLQNKIDIELRTVHNLATIVDLYRNTGINQFNEIIRNYLEITEDEFRSVKNQVIEDAINKLLKLANQKVSDELSTGEYYNWLHPMIEKAEPSSSLWAVSTMLDCEWDDSPYEERFLLLNMNAAKRGVLLERIFIVPETKFSEMIQNKGVKAHSDNSGQLKAWVVFRENIEKSDPSLVNQIGDGFIAFDERVALVDMSTPDGMRGYVTMNLAEIQKLKRLFERLRVFGRELNEVIEKKTQTNHNGAS